MYAQLMEDERGERWDDPLFFLQQAFSFVGD